MGLREVAVAARPERSLHSYDRGAHGTLVAIITTRQVQETNACPDAGRPPVWG